MELIRENIYNSFIYQDRYKYYLTGLGNTIIMAFFACLIGVILGLILSLVIDYNEKTGKLYLLSAFARMYIGIIRGTPALLQLMILYYIIFKSVNINIVVVGIISFGLNSGAYVSQIIKSGLISIPKGQEEASTMLGFNYFQTMKYVIMPQALRNVLPALGNEFITLLKETSVAGYIGILELTKASDIVASSTYDYFFPLLIVAIIYLILTLGLTKLLNFFERRLSK
ncbi:aBC transporter permease protein [Mycoplasma sp. CAG:472]|jgi:His/Glu/Gln/Arg/opine family amino acid ABC transporter permease subunit|nr:aBC transporter permease protein [Mycoplasma sp. CAG:472]